MYIRSLKKTKCSRYFEITLNKFKNKRKKTQRKTYDDKIKRRRVKIERTVAIKTWTESYQIN